VSIADLGFDDPARKRMRQSQEFGGLWESAGASMFRHKAVRSPEQCVVRVLAHMRRLPYGGNIILREMPIWGMSGYCVASLKSKRNSSVSYQLSAVLTLNNLGEHQCHAN
jgi:hypothetical protein